MRVLSAQVPSVHLIRLGPRSGRATLAHLRVPFAALPARSRCCALCLGFWCMLGPVLGWDHVWVLQKVLSELVSLDLESNPVSDLDEYPDALFDLIPQIQFIDDHDRCVCGGVVVAVVGTGVCVRETGQRQAGRAKGCERGRGGRCVHALMGSVHAVHAVHRSPCATRRVAPRASL